MNTDSKENTVARSLGVILRERRKELRLTLEQVSARADIDLSQLSKLERGIGSTSDETKVKIARALKMKPGDLMARAFGKSAA